jgi:hypothetical protein
VIEWPDDAEDKINRELYDHRGDDGTVFDEFENDNLAGAQQRSRTGCGLFGELSSFLSPIVKTETGHRLDSVTQSNTFILAENESKVTVQIP